MKTTTAEDIISRCPCLTYPPDRVRELLSSHERWTALELLDLPIPAHDRLWAVLHPSLIDDRTLRLLACRFAEDALMAERAAGREPDSRLWDAVVVSRRFANGLATAEELRAAEEAAGGSVGGDEAGVGVGVGGGAGGAGGGR